MRPVWLAAPLAALLLAACSSLPPPPAPAARAAVPDAALRAQLLQIDPEQVSDEQVRQVLAKGPTPRILSLHGGIYPVHRVMASFGRFLVGMGYPEDRLRHPGDGRYSHSPYEDGLQIAGLLAWYYEQDGLMPMMVGHSQGGIQLVKVLYLLAGQGPAEIAVWNPLTDSAEARTQIVDPATGRWRPVVGLRVNYAAVVGSGGAALLLPNQWQMVGRLQAIPDSVAEFAGYALEVDLIAWDGPGSQAGYRALGTAQVRNVRLPDSTSHVMVAALEPLATDPAVRAWINAYRPGRPPGPPPQTEVPLDNLLFAAEVWHGLKKHWVLEAQRALRTEPPLRAAAP